MEDKKYSKITRDKMAKVCQKSPMSVMQIQYLTSSVKLAKLLEMSLHSEKKSQKLSGPSAALPINYDHII